MVRTLTPNSAVMLASVVILLAVAMKIINGLPTSAPAFYPGFKQGISAETIWPSYVAHLSQAQPDKASGPQQNAFVYRIPGENQDIGTQISFTMPEEDDDFDGDNYEKEKFKGDPGFVCALAFLDMNELWGTADWASLVTKDQDFTIFALVKSDAVFSPNDTWNEHPAVDYHEAIGVVHANSSGIYVLGAEIACGFKNNLAQFWLQAVDDQSCEFSWAESQAPLSGLVIQKYELS